MNSLKESVFIHSVLHKLQDAHEGIHIHLIVGHHLLTLSFDWLQHLQQAAEVLALIVQQPLHVFVVEMQVLFKRFDLLAGVSLIHKRYSESIDLFGCLLLHHERRRLASTVQLTYGDVFYAVNGDCLPIEGEILRG